MSPPPPRFDLVRQEMLNNCQGKKKKKRQLNLATHFPTGRKPHPAACTLHVAAAPSLCPCIGFLRLSLAPGGLAKQSLVNPKISQTHQEDSKPKISLT